MKYLITHIPKFFVNLDEKPIHTIEFSQTSTIAICSASDFVEIRRRRLRNVCTI